MKKIFRDTNIPTVGIDFLLMKLKANKAKYLMSKAIQPSTVAQVIRLHYTCT